MTITAQQLDDHLEAMKNDAPNIRAQIKTATKVESEFFAKAYLWWRDASSETGYLEGRYKNDHIKALKRQDGISWRPLLSLVTAKQISETDLGLWTKALDRVHEEVSNRPQHYAEEAAKRIVYFIQQNGGKTGLAGYHGKPDKSRHDPQPVRDRSMLLEIAQQDCEPALLAEAIGFYGATKGHALAKGASIPLAANGFGLMLAREGGGGQEAVDLGNSAPLVEQVLISAYRSNFDALPATMTAVIEPLHILNVPHAVAPDFDGFVENAMLQDHDGKKSNRKPQKRFTYRPKTGDFLLSYGQSAASVVISAKPKAPLISRAEGDLFLPAYVRTLIETRLLYQRLFNLFTASAAQEFSMTPDDDLRQCIVSLKPKKAIIDRIATNGVTEDTVRAHVANLRHPPISFMPFNHDHHDLWQVEFKAKAFKPTWTASVSVGWLRDATSGFFDRWVTAYGNKSKRDMNKVMALELAKTMTINYELGANVGWGAMKVVEFHGDAATGQAGFTARSVDLAFVLRQIADLNITGSIDMKASSEAMVLGFATAQLSYVVHIPACNTKGQRSSKCFQRYDPVLSPQANDGETDTSDQETE
jgi:hypothetical protein